MKENGEFCKLFESESYGQLLVMVDSETDDFTPRVAISVKPKGLGVCTIAIGGWSDDEAGWDKAEKAFDDINLEKAEKFVRHALNSVLD